MGDIKSLSVFSKRGYPHLISEQRFKLFQVLGCNYGICSILLLKSEGHVIRFRYVTYGNLADNAIATEKSEKFLKIFSAQTENPPGPL